jgi:hypothetical protein
MERTADRKKRKAMLRLGKDDDPCTQSSLTHEAEEINTVVRELRSRKLTTSTLVSGEANVCFAALAHVK